MAKSACICQEKQPKRSHMRRNNLVINASMKESIKMISDRSKIGYYTIVVCLIFIIIITKKKRKHYEKINSVWFGKHYEKINSVFGKRSNISLALCSEFLLRVLKKLIKCPDCLQYNPKNSDCLAHL